MTENFNLPGSSFEELKKIVIGYSNSPDKASLNSLAQLTGLGTTTISSSNKFLSDLGLISGGNGKSPTELGKNLGSALENQTEERIKKFWLEAVQTNETFSKLVTTVRIQKGMELEKFVDHILNVSKQNKTRKNRTGARCVVDIFIAAGLLEEGDGKLEIATPQESFAKDKGPNSVELDKENQHIEDDSSHQLHSPAPNIKVNTPQIAINIQLHLPETENAEVYEKLFRALREQLIDPKE